MTSSPLSRREFLATGVRGAAALTLGGTTLLGGCPTGPTPDVSALVAPTTTPATVAIARGRDLTALTRTALDQLGGIATVVHPGESVFIKPNFLTAGLRRDHHSITGEIAKPEIVLAVAEACLIAGARHVTIGDGAQVRTFDWEELADVYRQTHLPAEVARLNATYDGQVQLACLNDDSPEWDPLPARRTSLDSIYVSSLVTRADRVISIPVLKTHRHATLSLSLKNFMGTTPIARYGGGSETVGRHKLHHAGGGVEGAFLDVVDGVRPDLAIIDASIGVEGYGPWVRHNEGRAVDLRDRLGDWLVLASTDLVAADATAARIIGHDPAHVRYLLTASQQGLGQIAADRITLVGATLDEVRMDWQPA